MTTRAADATGSLASLGSLGSPTSPGALGTRGASAGPSSSAGRSTSTSRGLGGPEASLSTWASLGGATGTVDRRHAEARATETIATAIQRASIMTFASCHTPARARSVRSTGASTEAGRVYFLPASGGGGGGVMIENAAPAGSLITAIRPYGVSNGGTHTLPPRSGMSPQD